MTAPRKKGKDLGNTKEAADPDSRKRGGGLALRAGGLPARHSLNGSLCMCIGDEAERDKREEMNKESQKKKWKVEKMLIFYQICIHFTVTVVQMHEWQYIHERTNDMTCAGLTKSHQRRQYLYCK